MRLLVNSENPQTKVSTLLFFVLDILEHEISGQIKQTSQIAHTSDSHKAFQMYGMHDLVFGPCLIYYYS